MNQVAFDSNIPIYLQIMHKIKQSIVAGELKPGERIPSVRDLSTVFGVNPNTMQRALTELEREGLLYSERTSGRFVTEHTEVIQTMQKTYAEELIQKFLNQMYSLGYTKEQVAKIIMEVKQ